MEWKKSFLCCHVPCVTSKWDYVFVHEFSRKHGFFHLLKSDVVVTFSSARQPPLNNLVTNEMNFMANHIVRYFGRHLFLTILLDQSLFCGTADCPYFGLYDRRFYSQGGSLSCTLTCLHVVILWVTSGATSAFSTNRGEHCVSINTSGLYIPHASRAGQAVVGYEPSQFADVWT